MWQKLFGEWFPGGRSAARSRLVVALVLEGRRPVRMARVRRRHRRRGFPTQHGQGPGAVSLSGGWTLAVGAQSKNPDAAFAFLAMALNRENSLAYNIANSQIAVRTDVAEDPPAYLDANPPFIGFFTDLVTYTHFRPRPRTTRRSRRRSRPPPRPS